MFLKVLQIREQKNSVKSGVADQWLTDPDPDPTLNINVFQDANKLVFFLIFFAYNFFMFLKVPHMREQKTDKNSSSNFVQMSLFSVSYRSIGRDWKWQLSENSCHAVPFKETIDVIAVQHHISTYVIDGIGTRTGI